jgi:hypothetical protein
MIQSAIPSGDPAAVRRGTGSDEEMLDRLQRAAFGYFQRTVNPANGLVADTTREGAPCSIAVVGFALTAWAIAVERGWMDREQAVDLVLAALNFFYDSPQDENPAATGYKGFYYHFLDMQTGRRAWQSELSMVDTAFLGAGILAAGAYFAGNSPREISIRRLADALYQRIDWPWARHSKGAVTHGWKPERGFLHYGWFGYNEAIILYILALGSAAHPLRPDSYHGWMSTYQWECLYNRDFLFAGPLFIHQFAHAWVDFRGIRDQFMREKKIDYFENSRRAAWIQRDYAIRNPGGYEGYGENCWGVTACDGPGRKTLKIDGKPRRFFGYAARGVPFGPDDGTISPSAALGALPFAPEIALPAIRHMLAEYPAIAPNYRLPSGFNPTLRGATAAGWISEGYFGLDQGLVLLMIENYRSQMIWNLMRSCPSIQSGLRRADFRPT